MRFITVILLFIAVSTELCAKVEHPHLLFSRDDIPNFKAKIAKDQVAKLAYNRLLQKCEKNLEIKKLSNKIVKSQLSDVKLDILSELAFAWQLNGNKSYAKHLNLLIQDAQNRDIKLARCGYNLALIFDWAYNALDEEKQLFLKNQIIEELETNEKFKRFPSFAIFSNWGYFMYKPSSIRYLLALYGHEEFDKKRVDEAALILKHIMSNNITSNGAASEHGAYLDYPMAINGSAIVMLERKNYDIFHQSNMPKLADYLLLNLNVAEEPYYLSLADCNNQAPNKYVLRLLLHLDSNNENLQYYASICGVDKDLFPDFLSAIIYNSSLNKVPKTPNVDKAKFFEEMNLLLYRSNWTNKSFQLATQAIVSRGHSHSDVGSFILNNKGVMRMIDPGYAIKEGTSHNIVTINGKGPSEHGGAGLINTQVYNDFGAIISIDSSNAWNNQVVNSSRFKSTPQVVYANRVICAVMPVENEKISQYLIVVDDLKSIENNVTYQANYQQLFSNTFKFNKNCAEISIPTSYPQKFPGEKTFEIEVPEDGEYYYHIFTSGKSGVTINIQGQEKQSKWINTSFPWRFYWYTFPKKVSLPKGKYSVTISATANLKAVYFGLGKEPIKNFSVVAEKLDVIKPLFDKEAKTTIFSLEPQNPSFKVKDVITKAAFQCHKTLEIPSEAGKFSSIIVPDNNTPKIEKLNSYYGFNYALRWGNSSDFFSIKYHDNRGTTKLMPRLTMLRLPNGNLPNLSDDTTWLIADGGDFKVGNKIIFLAKTLYDDKQEITSSRVCSVASAIYDGKSINVDLRLERNSNMSCSLVEITAFAPLAKKAFCNGKEVKFIRNGSDITFQAMVEETYEPITKLKEKREIFSEKLYEFNKGN